MVILNSDNCPPLNSSVTNILIIILLLVVNHGYEPQSKYWKYFAASCWVSYLRLNGIIRLTLPIVSESH
jgi:hypothetical protein